MEIKEQLKKILCDIMEINNDLISDEKKLNADLGINSISFIQAITRLEDNFKIDFDVDDLINVTDFSFGELVIMVEKQIAKTCDE